MSGKYRFRKSIASLNIKKQNEQVEVPASLGITIGGEYLVEVPNRDGYHYARIRDDLSELVQVYNDQTSPVYGLPVILVRDKIDKTRWRVKGRDLGRYNNWGTSAYLPRHGAQHSFDPSNPGADPVWVWGRQMMPLAAIPSGSSGAGNVIIEEGIYYRDGAWHFAGGTGTMSYLGYKPTDNTARLILTYIDANDNPQLLPSPSYIATNITGTMQIVPHIPNLPNADAIPIAVVRLVSGTSSVTWSDIYDLRPWIVGDGFIPTGTSSNISIYDNSVLSVTNPAGISFDTNLTVITSGTYAYVNATGGGGGGLSGIAIYDDSSFIVTGSCIHFNDNLTVVATGTCAYVDATGGSGLATSGWESGAGSWYCTGVDSPTFTVTIDSVNATGTYSPGMRINLTQGSSKYFILTKVELSGSDTLLSLYGGTSYTLVTGTAISTPYYSVTKSPYGFPLCPDLWTQSTTSDVAQSTSSPTQNQWYNALSLVVPIGCWDIYYKACVYSTHGSATNPHFHATTLSTANNSESDPDFSTSAAVDENALEDTFFVRKFLSVSTKTTYYLNYRTTSASVITLGVFGNDARTVIRATCAYL